jgi:hypothetical protein
MTYDEWKTTEPDPTAGYQPTTCECGAELTWDGRQWVEMTPCTCDPISLEEAEVCMGCSSDLDADGDCTSRTCTWNRCLDCGRTGETTGHMTCQYPQDRP